MRVLISDPENYLYVSGNLIEETEDYVSLWTNDGTRRFSKANPDLRIESLEENDE